MVHLKITRVVHILENTKRIGWSDFQKCRQKVVGSNPNESITWENYCPKIVGLHCIVIQQESEKV